MLSCILFLRKLLGKMTTATMATMATPTTSNQDSSGSDLDVYNFRYTPYYCEENAYFLCKKLCESGMADARDVFVVFISNENKQIPLWHQKASNRADGIVLWDYHVICIQRKRESNSPYLVFDLDSNLPFPSSLNSYVSETIRPSFKLYSGYQRFFRIVSAPMCFSYFASDRRHMKDSSGNWTAQPPDYEPIVAQDGTVHNLNEYIEITATDSAIYSEIDLTERVFSHKLGVVVSESELEDFFHRIP